VFWHTPALTRDAIESAMTMPRPLWENLEVAWSHVKMLARNLTNYAVGVRLIDDLRGKAATFDYLQPSDLDENHGYQDPATTRDELEIADHERFRSSIKAYREEVTQLDAGNERKVFLDSQPTHLLLDHLQKLEDQGFHVVCLIPPGLMATPEAYELNRRGLLPGFMPYNSPKTYGQLYAPDRHYDRGHVNSKGAEEFSRIFAGDLLQLELGPAGPER